MYTDRIAPSHKTPTHQPFSNERIKSCFSAGRVSRHRGPCLKRSINHGTG